MAYSESDIHAIKAFIEEEAQVWAKEFITGRVAYLRQRKIESSQELINSFAYEVNAQARQEAVDILLDFAEHGRYIDMRRMQPAGGGGEYIASIIDWMERKGLSQKMVDGYMKRRKLRKVPERVLVYIAWGIAVKRADGKYRKRTWYNKAKTAAITELYNIVAAGIPDIVATQIKDQFHVSTPG